MYFRTTLINSAYLHQGVQCSSSGSGIAFNVNDIISVEVNQLNKSQYYLDSDLIQYNPVHIFAASYSTAREIEII